MYSIMMTAERDVLMVRHWRVDPRNGQVVVAEFSLNEYPGAPKSGEGGRVRAVLTCGGAVITPNKDDPTACHVAVVNGAFCVSFVCLFTFLRTDSPWVCLKILDMDPMLGEIPDWAQVKLNELTTSMLYIFLVTLHIFFCVLESCSRLH